MRLELGLKRKKIYIEVHICQISVMRVKGPLECSSECTTEMSQAIH